MAEWLPPLIQEVDGPGPGSLGMIWRFFVDGSSPRASLHSAAKAVAAVDALLPYGARTVLNQTIQSPATALVLAAAVLIGIAAVALGWRRRQWFAVSLGVISLVGLLASIVAVTRITGELIGYLILWEIAVPLAGLTGLGVAVLAPREPVEAQLQVAGLSEAEGPGGRRPRCSAAIRKSPSSW